MKRRNLPFTLLLTIIVLAGITIGFSSPEKEIRYHARKTPSESLSRGIEQANVFLASIRNNQHSGIIAPKDLKRARTQLKNLKSQRETYNLDLKIMGPDNFGGRTRALLFDNRDASGRTLYAGAVTGGIWRSDNYGINWEQINVNGDNLNVSCIAQTPNGNFYVGTGENFNVSSMSGTHQLGYSTGFIGKGIYKSTDGDNFKLLPSTKPQLNDVTSDWAFINKLAVSGDNNIFAATNTGLKISTNGGETWVTAKDTAGTELNTNSFDVDVSSEGAVYAVVDNLLYYSSNGAADQFVLLSTGDSLSLPNQGISRMEIAIAPSDPNIIYASVSNLFGMVKGVYRSDDKGTTWNVIMPETESMVVFDGQGIYDQVLTVFPDNPDRILLGGTDLWIGNKPTNGILYNWELKSTSFGGPFFNLYVHVDHHAYVFANNGKDVFIGTDGGIFKGTLEGNDFTFEMMNRGYFTTQFYTVAACGEENLVMGGAQDNGVILIQGNGNTQREGHDIWFHDGGFKNGGDGGGVVISTINPKVIVYGSTKGAVRRSEDDGTNISSQFLQNGNGNGGDIGNPQAFITPVALWESFNNINSRDSVNYHANKAIPGGTDIIVKSNNSKYPFHYTTPADVNLQSGDSIMINDPISSRLFLATAGRIYMTKELHNFGKVPEWFTIANASVGYQGIPYTIAFSADGNHLYVGNYNGKLYRISNLALAYNYNLADVHSPSCIVAVDNIPVYIPGTNTEISQCITSISVDPNNDANVMITLGNYGNDYYVLYTQNALDKTPEFNSRQGNLPQMPVYSSIIDMDNPDLAIIGTDMGLFITKNLSAASPDWVPEGSTLGSGIVFDLYQQRIGKKGISDGIHNFPAITNYGDIYGATYGNGLIHSMVLRKPVGITKNIAHSHNYNIKIFPNPIINNATAQINSPVSGNLKLSIFNISGKVISSKNIRINVGVNTFSLNVDGFNSGIYIIKGQIENYNFQQKFIVK